MAKTTDQSRAHVLRMLRAVAERARGAGVFGAVTLEETPPRLVCAAPASPERAEFRVEDHGGTLYVSLVTPARYLSQSIEQDLVHQGDKIEELLADELIDQESAILSLRVEHFRDAEKLFTFRSALPLGADDLSGPDAGEAVARVLLAYAACFLPLGDLSAGAED